MVGYFGEKKMIGTVLHTLAGQLNMFLKKEFQLTAEVAIVKPVPTSPPTEQEVILSLIHVERETGAGISFSRRATSGGYSGKGAPEWLLNLYVLVAVAGSEKRYEESLHLLSGVALFLQRSSVFQLTEQGMSLAIEPVNLSFTELSNIWGICGGNYLPSLVCRIRVLNVDAGEMKQFIPSISKTDQRYE